MSRHAGVARAIRRTTESRGPTCTTLRLSPRTVTLSALPRARGRIPGVSLSVTFEVERFEWTGGDRLELVGRWFDVRGRRFLRPTLEVEVDGRSRRLLATLEHKPWAAQEGEEWLAGFAWDGGGAENDAARLTVRPDLAVELGPPATAAGGRPRRGKIDGR